MKTLLRKIKLKLQSVILMVEQGNIELAKEEIKIVLRLLDQ